MLEKLFAVIAKMPSTNTRIAVTLLLCIATGVRVVALGWEPPLEWLSALTLWLGLDVAQFVAKRSTHKGDTTSVGAS